jgi:hypothetical protein
MVNFKSIIKHLQKHYSDATEVVVINNKAKVLHSTSNWNVSKDIKGLLASWNSGNAQSVNMGGIRYSVLQMEPERFIATNMQKKGHLVGASIPNTDMLLVAHIRQKAKGWEHMAYPAIARAAAMMMKGSKSQFIETEINISDNNHLIMNRREKVEPTIDPYLKMEIESFLEWMKNPQGLQSYLSYSLQENNPQKISRLAEIYDEFYRLFYS